MVVSAVVAVVAVVAAGVEALFGSAGSLKMGRQRIFLLFEMLRPSAGWLNQKSTQMSDSRNSALSTEGGSRGDHDGGEHVGQSQIPQPIVDHETGDLTYEMKEMAIPSDGELLLNEDSMKTARTLASMKKTVPSTALARCQRWCCCCTSWSQGLVTTGVCLMLMALMFFISFRLYQQSAQLPPPSTNETSLPF